MLMMVLHLLLFLLLSSKSLDLDLEPVPPHTLPMPLDKLPTIHLLSLGIRPQETVVPYRFRLRACAASTKHERGPKSRCPRRDQARLGLVSLPVKAEVLREDVGGEAHGLIPLGFNGLTSGLEAWDAVRSLGASAGGATMVVILVVGVCDSVS